MLEMTEEIEVEFDAKMEWAKCSASVVYFIYNYCHIYSAISKRWIPFHLWPVQAKIAKEIVENRKTCIIKTRQFGFSWLVRCIILWKALFRPAINAVMYSKSKDDAKELLSDSMGLKGIYQRLPEWMKPDDPPIKNNTQQFILANGSAINARPYTQAEGGTYTDLFVDEIDRFPHGTDEELMANVGPAVEEAAEMVIIGSISDKAKPNSLLKNTFRAARDGKNDWHYAFIPWAARPDRTQEWYDNLLAMKILEYKDEASALDWMYQQYPNSADEAMAPNSQNKRIPYGNIRDVFIEGEPLKRVSGAPAVEGLKIFAPPIAGRRYVMGADPAEGVVGGDDSSCDVLDSVTGEQVATLRGKYEPKKVFPVLLFGLATFYNDAGILVERNNHGWGVLAELPEVIAAHEGSMIQIFDYPYENNPKAGWLSSQRGKTLLYDVCAEQILVEEVIIRDYLTAEQLGDIDIATLRAADGEHDDAADSFALACAARVLDPMIMEGQLMF